MLYPKRLTVHSGYTFVSVAYVFMGTETHNLYAANAMLLPLSHLSIADLTDIYIFFGEVNAT